MATILEKMLENCKKAGYYPTQNIEKIAKAKNMRKKDIAFPSFAAAILNVMVFVIAAAIKKPVPINNL